MQPLNAKDRTPARLALFVLGVLIAGAILAPALFFAAQSIIHAHPDSGVARLLESKGFPSYFNRAAMLAALIGLVPLLRSLRLSSREALGSVTAQRGAIQLSLGLGLATLGIVLMGLACWQFGGCKLKGSPAWTALALPLLSGLTVAALEELMFRGAILCLLVRSLGATKGLWWTTALFALVHFLKPPLEAAITADQVTWLSGFWVLSQLFRGFSEWQYFIGEFLLLFAVGAVLAGARLRTGGLWLSIGLHAGWVAGMKYFGGIVNTTAALREGTLVPWMVRNTCKAIVSPIVGIVPTLAVLITGAVALWLVRSPSTQKEIASKGE
jgi:hypothetical protein